MITYQVNDETGEVGKAAFFDITDIKGNKACQFHTGRILSISEQEFVLELSEKKRRDFMVKVLWSAPVESVNNYLK